MKRFLIVLLILCAPFSAFAQSYDINTIEQNIRQSLNIQDEYNLISRDVNQFEFSNGINFIQVSVDDSGIIMNYDLRENRAISSVKYLPSITRNDALRFSNSFLFKAAPDILQYLDMASAIVTYSNSSMQPGYNIKYLCKINGLYYKSNYITTFVSAKSKVVTRFSRVWDLEAEFMPVNNIIGFNQAKESFKNIGLELRYNKNIMNGNAQSYLVYMPKNNNSISAVTGNVILPKSQGTYDSYNDISAMFEKAMTKVEKTLTEEQVKEAEEELALSTGLKAQTYARTITELNITDDFEILEAKFFKNSNNQYCVTLLFNNKTDKIFVTLNAENKQIISYSRESSYPNSDEESISKQSSLHFADNFVNNYLPEYKEKCSPPIVIESHNDLGYSVLYERSVNGIPFKSNGIYFMFDTDGSFRSMAQVWDNISFSGIENIISKDEAYEILFDKVGFELAYVNTGGHTIEPAYLLKQTVSPIISADNGELLGYDGLPAKKQSGLHYIDLKGHYAEGIVLRLADCDIYVGNGDVSLNEKISQKDYILLLAAIAPDDMQIFSTLSGVVTDEQMDSIYSYLITKGVLTPQEVSPRGTISREVAVRYFIEILGYREIAGLEGIFKKQFVDASNITQRNYGYVSLARGLKIISGSDDGYFYPKNSLTNADALIMVYNYLNR